MIKINVPSLNERKKDIPILVDYFSDQICKEQGVQKKYIETEAINLLIEKNWSGNIRQLRNVIERLIILSDEIITKNDVKQYF